MVDHGYYAIPLCEFNLEQFINSDSSVDDTVRWKVCQDIMKGLECLHENNIIHGKLKVFTFTGFVLYISPV